MNSSTLIIYRQKIETQRGKVTKPRAHRRLRGNAGLFDSHIRFFSGHQSAFLSQAIGRNRIDRNDRYDGQVTSENTNFSCRIDTGYLFLTLVRWWEGGDQTSNTPHITLIGSKAMIVSSSRNYE